MLSTKYPDGFRTPLDKSPASNVPEPGEDVLTWACPPSSAEPPDTDGARRVAIPTLPDVEFPGPEAIAAELDVVRAELVQQPDGAALAATGVDVLLATSNAQMRAQAAALAEQLARPLVLESDGTTRPATSIWDETTAATLLAPDGHVIKSRSGRTCAPGTCGDQCHATAPLESPRPAPTEAEAEAAAYAAWLKATLAAVPDLAIAGWTRLPDGSVAAMVALRVANSPETREDVDQQQAAIEMALRKRGAAWRAHLALNAIPAFRDLLRAHAELLAKHDVEVGEMQIPIARAG
jgi:hypothetical protein